MLLNLRTSQPFEEVLEDLGQVLKMSGAKRMYTASGQEVRSFSQLRNEFAEIDTFYLGTNVAAIVPPPIIAGSASPIRRSRSRAGIAAGPPIIQEDVSKAAARQRARSKSRPRVLYAPESEIVRPSGGKLQPTPCPYLPECLTVLIHRYRLYTPRCLERRAYQSYNSGIATHFLSTSTPCSHG